MSSRGDAWRATLVRLLGYGGAALLIAVAIGILVVTFTRDARSRQAGDVHGGARGRPAATLSLVPVETSPAGVPGRTPGGGQGGSGGSTGGGGSAGGSGAGTDGAGGAVKRPDCAPQTASYTRAGDSITVRATLAGTGYVAVFVELDGRSNQSKSESGAGSHTFTFAGVPAAITKDVGLTTISQAGMVTCNIRAKG